MCRRALALAASFVLLCAPSVATGQSRTRQPASRTEQRRASDGKSSDLVAIRAEYAAVLLQAERYGEAAKEYRALLAIDSANASYRLGLARSLAWDNRFREADRELSVLVRQRRGDPTVAALVRSVRASYEPRASDAAAWVAERRDYPPYRFALARALVRERRARDAIAQYDTLLAARDSAPLLIGLAEAFTAAGDRASGIQRVRAAVDRQPGDSSIRYAFASVLTAAKRYDAAAAQYDTILARTPAAPIYLERARVNAARDRQAEAEADVRAALALKPSLETYLVLGDLHRQSGNYAAARSAYESARLLGARDARVLAAFALLAREERPVIAFMPEYDDGYLWQISGMTAGDNLGMSYSTTGVRRAVPMPYGVSGSVGAEYRRLGANDQFESRQVNGYALDAGATRAFVHGRLGGRVGAVAHSSAPAIPYFSVAATGWVQAFAASLEAAGGPSYPSLVTLSSLDDASGARALTERSLRLALGGPVRAADVAFAGERALLSDGNVRVTVEGFARYPIAPGVAAVYSLSVLRFAERSERYWDPASYVANAVGLEAATRRVLGWSAAVRFLPGVAQADEVGSLARVTSGTGTRTVAGQLTASGEMSYRARAWELAR